MKKRILKQTNLCKVIGQHDWDKGPNKDKAYWRCLRCGKKRRAR